MKARPLAPAPALHVFTLFVLAVAQPMFELIGLEPMVLVSHRATPGEILSGVLLVCLVLPAAALLAEFGLRRIRPWAGTAFRLLIVGLLTALIALAAWKRLVLLPAAGLFALAAMTGIAAAWAYWKFAAARALLSFAGPAVVVLPGLFLLREPVRSLLFPVAAVETAARQADNLPPVVMVVFDEFCGASLLDEHRRIDAVRYPHFAALAEEATWYRNATTVSENTMHALPALLTGKRPDHAAPPTVANYPHNLFTLLKDGYGYELNVFEPFTTLCPEEHDAAAETDDADRRARLLNELVFVYTQFLIPHDLAKLPERQRARQLRERSWRLQRQKRGGLVRYDRLEKRDEQFRHFVEGLRPSQRSSLHYLHVLLPHAPYLYLPSGRLHRPPGGEMAVGMQATMGVTVHRSDDPLEAAQEQQQYLLQLGFVDRLVGELVARLKSQALYDRCLLVLVADHGIAFRPSQPTRAATQENVSDIMSVPLLIKAPGQRSGLLSDRNVETIDVLPTMADLLDISLPWSTDGASAADPTIAERPQKQLDTVHHGPWRYDAPFLEKDASLVQSLRLFRSGADEHGLYRIGPHPKLVGQRIEDLTVAERAAARIECSWGLRSPLDDELNLAPCLVSGRFAGEDTAADALPVELAFSIDGQIRAVTRTGPGPERSWQVLLPEEAVDEPGRDFRVFVVKSVGGGLRLEPTIVEHEADVR